MLFSRFRIFPVLLNLSLNPSDVMYFQKSERNLTSKWTIDWTGVLGHQEQ